MALKYSFKQFFLKGIFELMIKTTPQGSNSVNGREWSCGTKPHFLRWS